MAGDDRRSAADGSGLTGSRGFASRAAPLALILMLSLIAACTVPPATFAPTPQLVATGVHGQVLAGPTCPVERPGESACVRPVEGAVIVARDASGAVAGRAVTDTAGAYFLPLQPGNYTIEPQPVEGLLGTARPATVEVTAGPPATLDLSYDTGIR
jgi:hypothetical protein